MAFIIDKKIVATHGQRLVRWMRRVLLTCGFLTLSYVGYTLINASIYQKNAALTLEKQIQAQERHEVGCPKRKVEEGGVLGRIEIPRIGVSVIVLQGTSSQTLRHGAGHIDGTALPGELGNIGIAGHRDTYFRGLKDIHWDDKILLKTTDGVSIYAVDWIQITNPNDGGIISPTTESALTLVTCYPFHYIGAAPERFVVHAHRQ